MGATYLLPCDRCDEVHRVETSQAGMMLPCRCGETIEVPTLRGLRELEQLEPDSPPGAESGWGPRQALVFLGLLIVACGIFAAALLWMTIPPYIPHEVDEAFVREQYQHMSLKESFDHFNDLKQRELKFVPDAKLFLWRAKKRTHQNWAIVSLCFAAAGLGLFGWGCFLPGSSAAVKK